MPFLIKLWTLGCIFFLMTIIRIGLHFIPLYKFLPWLSPSKRPADPNLDKLKGMTYYTDRLLNMFPYHERGNCLPRTCMLYWLAHRYGFPVTFHCGVRKGEIELEWHAWLSLNGEYFLERSRHALGMVETFSYSKEEHF